MSKTWPAKGRGARPRRSGAGGDSRGRVVSPVLWRKGIKTVDTLVLTHPHPDHLNGLVAVARNFRIGEFWEGPRGRNDARRDELARALPRSAPRRRCGRGFVRREGEATIAVLHPGAGAPGGNESSLVIKIAFGRTAFLFMGDAGPATERELLGTGLDLGAAVLKAGHHGSGASSSAAFLAAVRPEVVLVSVGEGNAYGFPGAGFLERCRNAPAGIFRTDVHGAVEVRSDGRSLRVRTAAGPDRGRFVDFRLTRTTK